MSHASDELELPTRWLVESNDCSCPGLTLFFDEDAIVELGHDEICWVKGPRHPDVSSCFDAVITSTQVSIDAWDPGCARTPCDAVVSADSLIATCAEGLVGSTCRVTLSADAM